MKSCTMVIPSRMLSFALLSHAKDILFNFAANFFFNLPLAVQGTGTQLPMHIQKFYGTITQTVLLMSNKTLSRRKLIGISVPKMTSAKLLLCLGFGLLCLGFGWLCRLFRLCRCCCVFSNFLFLRRNIIFWSFVVINNQPVFVGCCWLLSWDNAASYTALVKEASISSTTLYSCFYNLFSQGEVRFVLFCSISEYERLQNVLGPG